VKYFIFSLLFILTFSCANKEEDIISAKKEALYYLSNGDCSAAKKALDSVSPDSDDKVYVSLYASVYECLAGYKELTTVLGNLGSLDASALNLFSTLAAFNSSQEVTAPDDYKYTNILKALDVIQNSSTPTGAIGRIQKFGRAQAGELNYQALFLTTIALGKYLAAYGNVDATGSKGTGSGGATLVCLAQYNYSNVNNDYLDDLANDSCTGSTTANNNVSILITDTDYERRLCEGVVLYNNFLDLLINLELPLDTSELGNLIDAQDVLKDIKSAATTYLAANGDGPAISTYENIYMISTCVSTAKLNTPNKNYLEAYYSVFVEGNHN
jgi:hypothetical protein